MAQTKWCIGDKVMFRYEGYSRWHKGAVGGFLIMRGTQNYVRKVFVRRWGFLHKADPSEVIAIQDWKQYVDQTQDRKVYHDIEW